MEVSFFIFLVVVGTTIWMTYDSAAHQIPVSGNDYTINTGALAWFLSGFCLWIITFPFYLSRRSTVLRQRQAEQTIRTLYLAHSNTPPLPPVVPALPSQPSVPDELRHLKQLVDEGVITEQEFELKKKQLLGL